MTKPFICAHLQTKNGSKDLDVTLDESDDGYMCSVGVVANKNNRTITVRRDGIVINKILAPKKCPGGNCKGCQLTLRFKV